MAKFKYVPKTKKEKLVWKIMEREPHYSIGDNAEFLWNMDEDELEEVFKQCH